VGHDTATGLPSPVRSLPGCTARHNTCAIGVVPSASAVATLRFADVSEAASGQRYRDSAIPLRVSQLVCY